MIRILCILYVQLCISEVSGHGRFMIPASRSSLWRFPEFAKYNPPANYNDNELFCGAVHQPDNPGTDCGVCGDPISEAKPRDNEIGGTFYRGIITKEYKAGQMIDIEVDMTRSHKGAMEWRLCTNPKTENQDCFNKYVLARADGKGTTLPVLETGTYKTQLKLPTGVTCDHCIIQWNYRAGNNWGTCKNGTSSVGCGAQETFRGCSDVKIS